MTISGGSPLPNGMSLQGKDFGIEQLNYGRSVSGNYHQMASMSYCITSKESNIFKKEL